MRWNDLFSDLEGQFASRARGDFQIGVEELAVAERASVELGARLTASRDQPVTLRLDGGGAVSGTVADATPGWVLIRDGARDHLIPLASVVGAIGLTDRSLPLSEIDRRLTLGHALRVLKDRKVRVVVEAKGVDFQGSIVAVGADHLDVLTDSNQRVAVPFWALTRVTSA